MSSTCAVTHIEHPPHADDVGRRAAAESDAQIEVIRIVPLDCSDDHREEAVEGVKRECAAAFGSVPLLGQPSPELARYARLRRGELRSS